MHNNLEDNPRPASNRKYLSIFSLTMITVSSVDSIRNLPATALFGSQLVFFFIAGALFFLLPSALVSAELASGWHEPGGIYIWAREAFGKRIGFLAIWFQWIENVFWYPTILAFIAGTIGYVINPSLIQNKIFLISIILTSFWGATWLNLKGMQSSARFSNVCGMLGLLLPMCLIIGLGSVWLFKGKPLAVHFTMHDMLPRLHNPHMLVALTGIILSYCGTEIATVHAGEVQNPQRAFPKVLLYSVVIIISTLIFGSLAIAIVIPQSSISLVAGIMQAFATFFNAYHITWMLPVLGVMLVLGGLGGMSNWIIAPTKGLLIAARDNKLPEVLHQQNQHGAPKMLLIIQAIIVTLLASVFLLMPSVNGSYWLLTALTAQLYMFMYLIMFATGIALRLRKSSQYRAFKIPGGNWGMYIVAGMGIVGTLCTLAVGFIPPANIAIGSVFHYESLLLIGILVMVLPPFIATRFYNAADNAEVTKLTA